MITIFKPKLYEEIIYMFVVSLCCTSLYMIVADKIPYTCSIYSDGNFKRRHIGIQCVYFVVCKQDRSIYFKEISYAKFHRNPSNMNGWYAAIMIYSTGKINVCTDFEINRFRIDVMWRKKATSCVMGTATLLIDFRFRSYGSNSGFRVFGDLDLDLWHMFFFFVTRIAHDILEYLCEVSLESVQYEWVICCG